MQTSFTSLKLQALAARFQLDDSKELDAFLEELAELADSWKFQDSERFYDDQSYHAAQTKDSCSIDLLDLLT